MQDVVTIGEIYTAQLAMFVCAERVYGIAVQGRTQGGVGVKTPPLNLLCYKNVITYAKEFVYVFVHFLLV